MSNDFYKELYEVGIFIPEEVEKHLGAKDTRRAVRDLAHPIPGVRAGQQEHAHGAVGISGLGSNIIGKLMSALSRAVSFSFNVPDPTQQQGYWYNSVEEFEQGKPAHEIPSARAVERMSSSEASKLSAILQDVFGFSPTDDPDEAESDLINNIKRILRGDRGEGEEALPVDEVDLLDIYNAIESYYLEAGATEDLENVRRKKETFLKLRDMNRSGERTATPEQQRDPEFTRQQSEQALDEGKVEQEARQSTQEAAETAQQRESFKEEEEAKEQAEQAAAQAPAPSEQQPERAPAPRRAGAPRSKAQARVGKIMGSINGILAVRDSDEAVLDRVEALSREIKNAARYLSEDEFKEFVALIDEELASRADAEDGSDEAWKRAYLSVMRDRLGSVRQREQQRAAKEKARKDFADLPVSEQAAQIQARLESLKQLQGKRRKTRADKAKILSEAKEIQELYNIASKKQKDQESKSLAEFLGSFNLDNFSNLSLEEQKNKLGEMRSLFEALNSYPDKSEEDQTNLKRLEDLYSKAAKSYNSQVGEAGLRERFSDLSIQEKVAVLQQLSLKSLSLEQNESRTEEEDQELERINSLLSDLSDITSASIDESGIPAADIPQSAAQAAREAVAELAAPAAQEIVPEAPPVVPAGPPEGTERLAEASVRIAGRKLDRVRDYIESLKNPDLTEDERLSLLEKIAREISEGQTFSILAELTDDGFVDPAESGALLERVKEAEGVLEANGWSRIPTVGEKFVAGTTTHMVEDVRVTDEVEQDTIVADLGNGGWIDSAGITRVPASVVVAISSKEAARQEAVRERVERARAELPPEPTEPPTRGSEEYESWASSATSDLLGALERGGKPAFDKRIAAMEEACSIAPIGKGSSTMMKDARSECLMDVAEIARRAMLADPRAATKQAAAAASLIPKLKLSDNLESFIESSDDERRKKIEELAADITDLRSIPDRNTKQQNALTAKVKLLNNYEYFDSEDSRSAADKGRSAWVASKLKPGERLKDQVARTRAEISAEEMAATREVAARPGDVKEQELRALAIARKRAEETKKILESEGIPVSSQEEIDQSLSSLRKESENLKGRISSLENSIKSAKNIIREQQDVGAEEDAINQLESELAVLEKELVRTQEESIKASLRITAIEQLKLDLGQVVRSPVSTSSVVRYLQTRGDAILSTLKNKKRERVSLQKELEDASLELDKLRQSVQKVIQDITNQESDPSFISQYHQEKIEEAKAEIARLSAAIDAQRNRESAAKTEEELEYYKSIVELYQRQLDEQKEILSNYQDPSKRLQDLNEQRKNLAGPSEEGSVVDPPLTRARKLVESLKSKIAGVDKYIPELENQLASIGEVLQETDNLDRISRLSNQYGIQIPTPRSPARIRPWRSVRQEARPKLTTTEGAPRVEGDPSRVPEGEDWIQGDLQPGEASDQEKLYNERRSLLASRIAMLLEEPESSADPDRELSAARAVLSVNARIQNGTSTISQINPDEAKDFIKSNLEDLKEVLGADKFSGLKDKAEGLSDDDLKSFIDNLDDDSLRYLNELITNFQKDINSELISLENSRAFLQQHDMGIARRFGLSGEQVRESAGDRRAVREQARKAEQMPENPEEFEARAEQARIRAELTKKQADDIASFLGEDNPLVVRLRIKEEFYSAISEGSKEIAGLIETENEWIELRARGEVSDSQLIQELDKIREVRIAVQKAYAELAGAFDAESAVLSSLSNIEDSFTEESAKEDKTRVTLKVLLGEVITSDQAKTIDKIGEGMSSVLPAGVLKQRKEELTSAIGQESIKIAQDRDQEVIQTRNQIQKLEKEISEGGLPPNLISAKRRQLEMAKQSLEERKIQVANELDPRDQKLARLAIKNLAKKLGRLALMSEEEVLSQDKQYKDAVADGGYSREDLEQFKREALKPWRDNIHMLHLLFTGSYVKENWPSGYTSKEFKEAEKAIKKDREDRIQDAAMQQIERESRGVLTGSGSGQFEDAQSSIDSIIQDAENRIKELESADSKSPFMSLFSVLQDESFWTSSAIDRHRFIEQETAPGIFGDVDLLIGLLNISQHQDKKELKEFLRDYARTMLATNLSAEEKREYRKSIEDWLKKVLPTDEQIDQESGSDSMLRRLANKGEPLPTEDEVARLAEEEGISEKQARKMLMQNLPTKAEVRRLAKEEGITREQARKMLTQSNAYALRQMIGKLLDNYALNYKSLADNFEAFSAGAAEGSDEDKARKKFIYDKLIETLFGKVDKGQSVGNVSLDNLALDLLSPLQDLSDSARAQVSSKGIRLNNKSVFSVKSLLSSRLSVDKVREALTEAGVYDFTIFTDLPIEGDDNTIHMANNVIDENGEVVSQLRFIAYFPKDSDGSVDDHQKIIDGVIKKLEDEGDLQPGTSSVGSVSNPDESTIKDLKPSKTVSFTAKPLYISRESTRLKDIVESIRLADLRNVRVNSTFTIDKDGNKVPSLVFEDYGNNPDFEKRLMDAIGDQLIEERENSQAKKLEGQELADYKAGLRRRGKNKGVPLRSLKTIAEEGGMKVLDGDSHFLLRFSNVSDEFTSSLSAKLRSLGYISYINNASLGSSEISGPIEKTTEIILAKEDGSPLSEEEKTKAVQGLLAQLPGEASVGVQDIGVVSTAGSKEAGETGISIPAVQNIVEETLSKKIGSIEDARVALENLGNLRRGIKNYLENNSGSLNIDDEEILSGMVSQIDSLSSEISSRILDAVYTKEGEAKLPYVVTKTAAMEVASKAHSWGSSLSKFRKGLISFKRVGAGKSDQPGTVTFAAQDESGRLLTYKLEKTKRGIVMTVQDSMGTNLDTKSERGETGKARTIRFLLRGRKKGDLYLNRAEAADLAEDILGITDDKKIADYLEKSLGIKVEDLERAAEDPDQSREFELQAKPKEDLTKEEEEELARLQSKIDDNLMAKLSYIKAFLAHSRPQVAPRAAVLQAEEGLAEVGPVDEAKPFMEMPVDAQDAQEALGIPMSSRLLGDEKLRGRVDHTILPEDIERFRSSLVELASLESLVDKFFERPDIQRLLPRSGSNKYYNIRRAMRKIILSEATVGNHIESGLSSENLTALKDKLGENAYDLAPSPSLESPYKVLEKIFRDPSYSVGGRSLNEDLQAKIRSDHALTDDDISEITSFVDYITGYLGTEATPASSMVGRTIPIDFRGLTLQGTVLEAKNRDTVRVIGIDSATLPISARLKLKDAGFRVPEFGVMQIRIENSGDPQNPTMAEVLFDENTLSKLAEMDPVSENPVSYGPADNRNPDDAADAEWVAATGEERGGWVSPLDNDPEHRIFSEFIASPVTEALMSGDSESRVKEYLEILKDPEKTREFLREAPFKYVHRRFGVSEASEDLAKALALEIKAERERDSELSSTLDKLESYRSILMTAQAQSRIRRNEGNNKEAGELLRQAQDYLRGELGVAGEVTYEEIQGRINRTWEERRRGSSELKDKRKLLGGILGDPGKIVDYVDGIVGADRISRSVDQDRLAVTTKSYEDSKDKLEEAFKKRDEREEILSRILGIPDFQSQRTELEDQLREEVSDLQAEGARIYKEYQDYEEKIRKAELYRLTNGLYGEAWRSEDIDDPLDTTREEERHKERIKQLRKLQSEYLAKLYKLNALLGESDRFSVGKGKDPDSGEEYWYVGDKAAPGFDPTTGEVDATWGTRVDEEDALKLLTLTAQGKELRRAAEDGAFVTSDLGSRADQVDKIINGDKNLEDMISSDPSTKEGEKATETLKALLLSNARAEKDSKRSQEIEEMSPEKIRAEAARISAPGKKSLLESGELTEAQYVHAVLTELNGIFSGSPGIYRVRLAGGVEVPLVQDQMSTGGYTLKVLGPSRFAHRDDFENGQVISPGRTFVDENGNRLSDDGLSEVTVREVNSESDLPESLRDAIIAPIDDIGSEIFVPRHPKDRARMRERAHNLAQAARLISLRRRRTSATENPRLSYDYTNPQADRMTARASFSAGPIEENNKDRLKELETKRGRGSITPDEDKELAALKKAIDEERRAVAAQTYGATPTVVTPPRDRNNRPFGITIVGSRSSRGAYVDGAWVADAVPELDDEIIGKMVSSIIESNEDTPSTSNILVSTGDATGADEAARRAAESSGHGLVVWAGEEGVDPKLDEEVTKSLREIVEKVERRAALERKTTRTKDEEEELGVLKKLIRQDAYKDILDKISVRKKPGTITAGSRKNGIRTMRLQLRNTQQVNAGNVVWAIARPNTQGTYIEGGSSNTYGKARHGSPRSAWESFVSEYAGRTINKVDGKKPGIAIGMGRKTEDAATRDIVEFIKIDNFDLLSAEEAYTQIKALIRMSERVEFSEKAKKQLEKLIKEYPNPGIETSRQEVTQVPAVRPSATEAAEPTRAVENLTPEGTPPTPEDPKRNDWIKSEGRRLNDILKKDGVEAYQEAVNALLNSCRIKE